jgi:hypothetical protein
MTSLDSTADKATHERHGEHSDRDTVTVELNGTPRRIKSGDYTGRALRLALGVPVEYELDQVTGGEFKPISNEEQICVQGGEKFVSHIGQGQAS